MFNFLIKALRKTHTKCTDIVITARLDFLVNSFVGGLFNSYFSKIFFFYFFFIKHFVSNALNFKIVALPLAEISKVTAFSLTEYSGILFIFIFFVDALLLLLLALTNFVLFRIPKNQS